MRAEYLSFDGRSFADSINDAVVILDQEGAINWWNRAAGRILGLSAHMKQQNIVTMLQLPTLKASLSGNERGNLECPSPVYQDRMLSLLLIPYQKDQFLMVAQDISPKQHVDKMRRDFVANVSHELRTPLTVIHGYLEMMVQHVDQLPTAWRSSFNEMLSQTLRMELLVEDLLLLSRLENQEIDQKDLEVINVPELLSSIVGEAKTVSNGKHKFSVGINNTLTLKGIESELRSAFSNLVINAVRYTPEGGIIKVHWYADNTGTHFAVRDTGIGIAETDIHRITERFYRIDRSRSRESGGTGLGLSIVKHVLLRHEASLYIQSELGKGSLFRCDFAR